MSFSFVGLPLVGDDEMSSKIIEIIIFSLIITQAWNQRIPSSWCKNCEKMAMLNNV